MRASFLHETGSRGLLTQAEQSFSLTAGRSLEDLYHILWQGDMTWFYWNLIRCDKTSEIIQRIMINAITLICCNFGTMLVPGPVVQRIYEKQSSKCWRSGVKEYNAFNYLKVSSSAHFASQTAICCCTSVTLMETYDFWLLCRLV